MSRFPLRLESKASHFPSWETAIPSMDCRSVVTARAADKGVTPSAAIGAIQMLDRSRRVLYAICEPSGVSVNVNGSSPLVTRSGAPRGRPLELTFTILGVYRGERTNDTVISELWFDGTDVH